MPKVLCFLDLDGLHLPSFCARLEGLEFTEFAWPVFCDKICDSSLSVNKTYSPIALGDVIKGNDTLLIPGPGW